MYFTTEVTTTLKSKTCDSPHLQLTHPTTREPQSISPDEKKKRKETRPPDELLWVLSFPISPMPRLENVTFSHRKNKRELLKGFLFFSWKIRADHTTESCERLIWDSQWPYDKAKTLGLPHLPFCHLCLSSAPYLPRIFRPVPDVQQELNEHLLKYGFCVCFFSLMWICSWLCS